MICRLLNKDGVYPMQMMVVDFFKKIKHLGHINNCNIF